MTRSDYTDEFLINGLNKKEGTEFDQAICGIYIKCQKIVMNSLSIFGCSKNSEDLVQEAIIRLIIMIRDKSLEISKTPCALLLRVAKFLCYAENRTKNRLTDLNFDSNSPEPIIEDEFLNNFIKENWKDEVLDKLFLECLKELPNKGKELFYDLYFKQLSFKEIQIKYSYANMQVLKSTISRYKIDLKDCINRKLPIVY